MLPVGQKYRKFSHFILDSFEDLKVPGDPEPFYNEGNAVEGTNVVVGDSVFHTYGEIDDDEVDYSYEDDPDLTASEYDREAFKARIEAMEYGNSFNGGARGFGKYNFRPGKNLTAFIKFAFDFYKNQSGEKRVGKKTKDEVAALGEDFSALDVCPMELLEEYANKNYINSESGVGLEGIYYDCLNRWEYQGDKEISNDSSIFSTLEDIFMCYVYLLPGVKKISRGTKINISDLTDEDYAAILSMMYERFGGRPISPDVNKIVGGQSIPVVGFGDVLGALIDIEDMSISERIYRYMIEIKYKNNSLKLASWLKEYEEIYGPYTPLEPDDYDRFKVAYNEAFKKYGLDTANDTLLDYGYERGTDFSSKVSYEKALKSFSKTITKYFGNSSFYKNKDNAMYVARSYSMMKKICENDNFADITDIYACDMDVVEHTYGYGDYSTNILLADTSVVELDEPYNIYNGADTDIDGLRDNEEVKQAE